MQSKDIEVLREVGAWLRRETLATSNGSDQQLPDHLPIQYALHTGEQAWVIKPYDQTVLGYLLGKSITCTGG